MLTISHTYQEGTLIAGTRKGDGASDVLKTLHWKWGRSISAWYIPYSRDHLPNTYRINQAVKALQEAGFEVITEIDATPVSTEAVEAAKASRADQRAAALAAKANRREYAAEAAWEASERAQKALPPFGEPIKVGHHSEGPHRRALDTAWKRMGQAVEAQKEAEEASRRAQVAATATDRRFNPETVGNRIEKLEADLRDIERKLAGTRSYEWPITSGGLSDPASWEVRKPEGSWLEKLEARQVEVSDQISYWRSVRSQQIEDGVAVDPASIRKGDVITYWGARNGTKVVRVNKKSVTVEETSSYNNRVYTRTVPYQQITSHGPA